MFGADFERCDHSGPDRHDDRASEELGNVVAALGGEGSGHDTRDDEGEDERESVDAGMHCGLAFDGLKPDGEEIYDDHHRAGRHSGEISTGSDAALLDDSEWHGGTVSAFILDEEECDDEYSSDDEESDDTRAGPWICGSAPLQCEQETNDAGKEDHGAERVEFHDLLTKRVGVLAWGRLEDEEKDDDDDSL